MNQISLFTKPSSEPEPSPTTLMVQAPLPAPFDSLPILLSPTGQEAVFGGTVSCPSPKQQLKGEPPDDTQ